jgi:hypothetical protein
MAEATKTQGKSKKKAPAAATAPAEGDAAPAAASEVGCSVEKCKQPVRAKGYCRKHYFGWRRGALGKKHRYKTCSREGCRKARTLGGLCDEHAGKAKTGEGGG